jgi:hypothetical protein
MPEVSERRYPNVRRVCFGERDLAAYWRRRSIPADICLLLDGTVILVSEVLYDAADATAPYVVRRHHWRPAPDASGPGVLRTVLVSAGGWVL